jgi:glycosyltransferase involved in cell wall biosynthesis
VDDSYEELAGPLKVFFAFRDAPERRAVLHSPESLDRYRLFGLDETARRGAHVRHNLERDDTPTRWSRATRRAVNGTLDAAGALGGDFATILDSRSTINDADVVFSTVDTVGIPLMLLKRARLVRPPLVYTAIGLPERLARLRNERARRLFRSALRSTHTIIAYSAAEAERLREWIGSEGPPVVFVPFGVDLGAFRPADSEARSVDVVAIGADPQRDFELLLSVAARRPHVSFLIVASADRVRALGSAPANVVIETDIPLEAVRERFAQARVVALPVRANSYSGATTTLLQAMAMAKPVVVSRTEAIDEGYDLANGVNCRLVAPGDAEAFGAAVDELLADPTAAAALGQEARSTVAAGFSWQRYTDALWRIVSAAAEASRKNRR